MQKFKGQYITDKKGKRTAAIIPIDEYEELLEDLHDLSIVAERRDEPTITSKALKERLRKNELL